MVAHPSSVALTGTVEGVSGPVSAVSFVFWVLATTVTLLVRPGPCSRTRRGPGRAGRRLSLWSIRANR